MNEINSRLTDPKTVAAGRGAGWVTDGFGIFKSSPLAWIGAYIIFFILVMVISLIPLLSVLLNIFFPVIMGGFMLGCREQEQGGAFRVDHLFAGFTQPCFGRLVILGVLFFVASILLVSLMILIFGMLFFLMGGTGLIEQIQNGQVEQAFSDPRPILLACLIGALLAMPLLMAEWFAPALITFQESSPVDAMVASFRGCLVNVMPFLVYGVVGFVLMIIAALPLMLGYIVLLPVLTASVYTGYRDIFEEQNPAS